MGRIIFNYQTKTWDKLTKDDPKSDMDIELSDLRLKYLDRVKKDLQNDLDHVEVIGGAVGSGKSTLGRLDCRYVSNETFRPDTHIIREVKDIKPVILNSKRGDGILIDEGSGIFSGTDTMTKKTKYANYILDVCRQKNLLIVISAPNFHRLTAAVAVDRAITFSRVYIDKDTGRRGKFAFYGQTAKEKLYRFAKKNYGSMKGARPKYRGRFGEDKTFTQEYLKLKDDTLSIALDSFESKKDKEKIKKPKEIIQDYRVDIVKQNIDKPIPQMAELLSVSTRTIERWRVTAKEQILQDSENLENEKKIIVPTTDTQT